MDKFKEETLMYKFKEGDTVLINGDDHQGRPYFNRVGKVDSAVKVRFQGGASLYVVTSIDKESYFRTIFEEPTLTLRKTSSPLISLDLLRDLLELIDKHSLDDVMAALSALSWKED